MFWLVLGAITSPLRGIVEAFRRDRSLERGIFAFHDGKRKRFADPLKMDALLKKNGGAKLGDLISVLALADAGLAKGGLAAQAETQREEAVNELVEIARKVFDLLEVEDGGVTGAECLQILARYLGFLATLKERHGPLAISPARLATSPEEQVTGDK